MRVRQPPPVRGRLAARRPALRVVGSIEVPNVLPLILGGLRTARLQVVVAATVAAYASLRVRVAN